MFTYPFRMASGTATLVLIDAKNRKVLNGIRSKSAWVYPNANSLPGGFMEARRVKKPAKNWRESIHRWCTKWLLPAPACPKFHEGETLEQAAVREAKEELNVDLLEEQLTLFAVWSDSRTDTRAHVINACYYAELTDEQIQNIKAGDDLEDIVWFDLHGSKSHWVYQPHTPAEIENAIPMAFNHATLMAQGIKAWERDKLAEKLIADFHAPGKEIING